MNQNIIDVMPSTYVEILQKAAIIFCTKSHDSKDNQRCKLHNFYASMKRMKQTRDEGREEWREHVRLCIVFVQEYIKLMVE